MSRAGLPRPGFRPTADRLADGLRHAAAPTRYRRSIEIAEVLSPTNPLGIKAGGEGGTTAAPAAVVSGILDALRSTGVRDIQMPATPYTIWSAIQNAKNVRPRAAGQGG